MKLCLTSDLHGHLPKIPDCDVLCLCGDYAPSTRGEHSFLVQRFAPWLSAIADRGIKVVGVAGNHDFLFQQTPRLVPSLKWTYLQDSGCEIDGVKFYGSPWQPVFYDWAFNATEDRLEQIWAKIPAGTDVLLLHGPPHGFGDLVYNHHSYGAHVGSPSLTERIREVKPKIVACGHIHEGFGRYDMGATTVYNVSHCNGNYSPENPPVVVELP